MPMRMRNDLKKCTEAGINLQGLSAAVIGPKFVMYISFDNHEHATKMAVPHMTGQSLAGEKEKCMPTYEYKCKDCKKIFTLVQSISDHGKTKVSCPACKGKKVKPVMSIFMAKTSRKS